MTDVYVPDNAYQFDVLGWPIRVLLSYDSLGRSSVYCADYQLRWVDYHTKEEAISVAAEFVRRFLQRGEKYVAS